MDGAGGPGLRLQLQLLHHRAEDLEGGVSLKSRKRAGQDSRAKMLYDKGTPYSLNVSPLPLIILRTLLIGQEPLRQFKRKVQPFTVKRDYASRTCNRHGTCDPRS